MGFGGQCCVKGKKSELKKAMFVLWKFKTKPQAYSSEKEEGRLRWWVSEAKFSASFLHTVMPLPPAASVFSNVGQWKLGTETETVCWFYQRSVVKLNETEYINTPRATPGVYQEPDGSEFSPHCPRIFMVGGHALFCGVKLFSQYPGHIWTKRINRID